MICSKVRFRTQQDAADALVVAKIARELKHNNKRKECRYYRCPTCAGFHLTSKPLRGGQSAAA